MTTTLAVSFDVLRDKLAEHFALSMKPLKLFTVHVTKEEMWDTYLSSFPPGTNPMFRERTEHNCSCCRHFIRDMGAVVAIDQEQTISIWDIPNLPEPYRTVAKAMSDLIHSRPINSVFFHDQEKVGTPASREASPEGKIHTWTHFHCELSPQHIVHRTNLATRRGHANTTVEVIRRSLDEITIDAVETVLDLINQQSLYRGEEHKHAVKTFLTAKRYYDTLDAEKKNLFVWASATPIVGIRNTVIGTLLTDLSEGRELDTAVTAFEQKVAPTNYKRPTALITQKMVRNAEAKVTELGLLDSLPRRHCQVSDLTINALEWADRSVKQEMSVFDGLATAAAPCKKGRSFSKSEEVPIDKFLTDVLPNAAKIEALVENQHLSNLMTLLAPVHADAAPLFKWGNNFSWTYNGEVADSIKERVKKAGGNVTGLMRASLAWFNYDDLDIHIQTPSGEHIYYGNKITRVGSLDVDMNAGVGRSRSAVENITWPTKTQLKEGVYEIWVNNYQKRETDDPGFVVELEYNNTLLTFNYPKALTNGENVPVAKFKFSYEKGIEIIKSLPAEELPKTEWGITTQQFIPVRMVLNSPNYWADKGTGNRHLFFILDNCKNPNSVRGFFNEYLRSDLDEHRKVFEILGSKMKAEPTDEQLSGLGFSSTQRNHLICRVSGSFNRTIKITF